MSPFYECYLTMLSVLKISDVGWRKNCEGFGLKRLWSNGGTIPTMSCRDWGKSRHISVRISGVSADNKTEHFPNIGLECCRLTNPPFEKLDMILQSSQLSHWSPSWAIKIHFNIILPSTLRFLKWSSFFRCMLHRRLTELLELQW
jgi:hypothetical protein